VVFRARLIKEPATGSIPMPCHFHRAHSSYNRLAVKWVLLKNNYLILACYRVLAAKGSFLPYTFV
jgi:hypothetical protein